MGRIRDFGFKNSNKYGSEKTEETDESSVDTSEETVEVYLEEAVTVNADTYEDMNRYSDSAETAPSAYTSPYNSQTESAEAVSSPTVEKIVCGEADLSPKYSDAGEALLSITRDGRYYEDYARGADGGVLRSKEFVLAAISQNYDRFYAPETPKPDEWIDEEYLAAQAAHFFERTREGEKQEENTALAESLYGFLTKSAFAPAAYDKIIAALKRVAKVEAARIRSVEEGARLRESISVFNSALNSVLNTVKEKRRVFVAAETERAEKLKAEKLAIVDVISEMRFEI
jgi:hypothetical protein